MSVVNHYFCDICRKELDKCCLYRFKLNEDILYDDMNLKEVESEFDICDKCLKKITKQIRKER